MILGGGPNRIGQGIEFDYCSVHAALALKKLGFETIAEGVETEEQFRYLNEIDCDNIQGFYLGKPMPSKEIENLLANMTA